MAKKAKAKAAGDPLLVSVILAPPAGDVDNARTLFEALSQGDGCFSVPLYEAGTDPTVADWYASQGAYKTGQPFFEFLFDYVKGSPAKKQQALDKAAQRTTRPGSPQEYTAEEVDAVMSAMKIDYRRFDTKAEIDKGAHFNRFLRDEDLLRVEMDVPEEDEFSRADEQLSKYLTRNGNEVGKEWRSEIGQAMVDQGLDRKKALAGATAWLQTKVIE